MSKRYIASLLSLLTFAACLPVGDASPCHYNGVYDVTANIIGGNCSVPKTSIEYTIDQPIGRAVVFPGQPEHYRLSYSEGYHCDLVESNNLTCQLKSTCFGIKFDWIFYDGGFYGTDIGPVINPFASENKVNCYKGFAVCTPESQTCDLVANTNGIKRDEP